MDEEAKAELSDIIAAYQRDRNEPWEREE